MSTVDLWPAWLTGFVDDAAIFPPGNLPLEQAVAEHFDHQDSEYAALVGGFVISDVKVPDLVDVLDQRDEDRSLGINLVISGGAGAVEPALRWATRAPLLHLRAVEIPLRDDGDPAQSARRTIAALDAQDTAMDEVDVYLELPKLDGEPTHAWLSALDEIGARGLRAKFRTGGVEQHLFPTCGELGAAIEEALNREIPFKCTAGLHHAVRHHDPETDLTHHGFLNVLRATRASLDGEDCSEVLAEESAAVLLDGFDADEASRTRRWFTGFGSCSVLEPHHDLVEVGLL